VNEPDTSGIWLYKGAIWSVRWQPCVLQRFI
jgi:hypothetical protein